MYITVKQAAEEKVCGNCVILNGMEMRYRV